METGTVHGGITAAICTSRPELIETYLAVLREKGRRVTKQELVDVVKQLKVILEDCIFFKEKLKETLEILDRATKASQESARNVLAMARTLMEGANDCRKEYGHLFSDDVLRKIRGEISNDNDG